MAAVHPPSKVTVAQPGVNAHRALVSPQTCDTCLHLALAMEAQHSAIFHWVYQFMQARKLPELQRCAQRLSDLTCEHFAYEERLMQCFAFSDLQEHARSHAHLLERLRKLNRQLSGDLLDKMEMGVFLKHWAHTHSLLADARFAALLRNGDFPGSFL